MNRASKLALVLFLVSAAALAQTSVRDRSFVPLEADCPIVIRATLEKRGNPAPAQRLQVTLTKSPGPGILASRITVHGIVALANRPEPSEVVQNLNLNRILDPRLIGSPGSLPGWEPYPTGDLQGILPPFAVPVVVKTSTARPPDSKWYAWVSGFTGVNFIDLESVSYADGTSWHVSNGKTCRVSVGSSFG